MFAIDQQNASEPYLTSGFPVDFAFQKRKDNSSNWMTGSRLQGARQLNLDLTSAEANETAHEWDYMDGFRSSGYASDWFGWMWKRAPSYFDVVAYSGNSTAGRTVSHNLGIAPEMMWVKRRDSANDWVVYHKGMDSTAPEDYGMYLNDNAQRADSVNFWNDTAPTSSVFTLGTASKTNNSSGTYIAYLFATVAGVSKVGSYTGDATDGRQIDCGFTSGARFVLIKRSDGVGNWMVFDTERGIVSGNDPFLKLNATGAETSTDDKLDPYSGGFIVNHSGASINNSGDEYIFYAIA